MAVAPQNEGEEVVVDESKIIHVWRHNLEDAFKEICIIVTTVRLTITGNHLCFKLNAHRSNRF
jgi:hypothetical protein